MQQYYNFICATKKLTVKDYTDNLCIKYSRTPSELFQPLHNPHTENNNLLNELYMEEVNLVNLKIKDENDIDMNEQKRKIPLFMNLDKEFFSIFALKPNKKREVFLRLNTKKTYFIHVEKYLNVFLKNETLTTCFLLNNINDKNTLKIKEIYKNGILGEAFIDTNNVNFYKTEKDEGTKTVQICEACYNKILQTYEKFSGKNFYTVDLFKSNCSKELQNHINLAILKNIYPLAIDTCKNDIDVGNTLIFDYVLANIFEKLNIDTKVILDLSCILKELLYSNKNKQNNKQFISDYNRIIANKGEVMRQLKEEMLNTSVVEISKVLQNNSSNIYNIKNILLLNSLSILSKTEETNNNQNKDLLEQEEDHLQKIEEFLHKEEELLFRDGLSIDENINTINNFDIDNLYLYNVKGNKITVKDMVETYNAKYRIIKEHNLNFKIKLFTLVLTVYENYMYLSGKLQKTKAFNLTFAELTDLSVDFKIVKTEENKYITVSENNRQYVLTCINIYNKDKNTEALPKYVYLDVITIIEIEKILKSDATTIDYVLISDIIKKIDEVINKENNMFYLTNKEFYATDHKNMKYENNADLDALLVDFIKEKNEDISSVKITQEDFNIKKYTKNYSVSNKLLDYYQNNTVVFVVVLCLLILCAIVSVYMIVYLINYLFVKGYIQKEDIYGDYYKNK